jgi:hypothetical protein
MADAMLSIAAASASPCDQQPGSAGHWTAYPSSERTSTTGYVMTFSVPPGGLRLETAGFVNAREFHFEWDDNKARNNVRKHGVSFELAATVFQDSRLVAVADLEHSEAEDRWFSVGVASNGMVLTVVYTWAQTNSGVTKVRLISARKASEMETKIYWEHA